MFFFFGSINSKKTLSFQQLQAMKIIIAPDKFKGSLTSFEVCDAIATGIKQADSSVEIFSFPMADGGDGFASVLQHYYKTETVYCDTVDPLYRKINATYQWNKVSKTAIIEMAVASGLVLLKAEERSATKTSTFGTGMIIRNAIEKGADKIILGLGGSATNDAGIGILAALGFLFIDEGNNELSPVGESLLYIKKIIAPRSLPGITIEIALDVQNTLYGPQGAAYIYAPQKGADEKAIKLLDEGLRNFAFIVQEQTGKDISSIPGTGAAGGIAAGLLAFFDVILKKGIDMVIEASGIEKEIDNTNLIITGEGKMDKQTLDGKVVSKMAALANERNIPVIAFCGISEESNLLKQRLNITHIESLVSEGTTKEAAMNNGKNILIKKAKQVYQNNFNVSNKD